MTNGNRILLNGLLVLLGAGAAACSGSPTNNINNPLTCTETADCSHSGGSCIANECTAENQCETDADCTGGQTCVADEDFGGLCTTPGEPPAPLPAWACTAGAQCPEGQGCASDGFCHVDGECTLHWTPEGYLESDDCATGEICAASGASLEGFCSDERNGPDPYCRADGDGACRTECASDAECGTGGTCTGGFCHSADECTTTDDCTPNHICGVPEGYEDYGLSFCLDDPNPVCIDDGAGACRLACEVDLDCLHGGGCAADGLCHASNECTTTADCEAPLLCYPDEEFGGLCGPERPE
jgi:hypothetical protein